MINVLDCSIWQHVEDIPTKKRPYTCTGTASYLLIKESAQLVP
ncbi:hypothetical protein GYMC10_0700 [Paenibacillus sp. Y412MC10]|nr:hypothetical protein GYMC10_0700 [Paenibacillus sp. Y412MC10]